MKGTTTMTTYTIKFTDFTGNFWTMNWEPSTIKNKPLTDTDLKAVFHFIKTGNWPATTSSNAKNCYDALAAQIANTIIEDSVAAGPERLYEVVRRIEQAYDEYKLSPKAECLYERCRSLCEEARSTDNTLRMRKLMKKIIKTDNLFAVKFAEDENWLVEVSAEMKCCICGAAISDDRHSHNPYPVRPESWYGEKENRCCGTCNQRIVIPARIRCGRNVAVHRNLLMEMDYEDLLDFVA